MLAGLGLTEAEEAVYRCLLGRASASAPELSVAVGRSAAEVAADLVSLAARGLAAQSAGDSGRYVAASPTIALGALLTQRREELRVAEVALVALAEEHRSAVADRAISDLIEVVTGPEAVRQRFLQIQHAASTVIRSFVTAPFEVVPFDENTAEAAARDRGVHFRVILEREVLASPGATADAAESIAAGVEARVVDRLPIKLMIADDQLALVPLTAEPPGVPGAVVLHASGLLTGMIALFEQVWAGAYPLRLTADPADPASPGDPGDRVAEPVTRANTSGELDTLDTVDTRVLSLLIAGLTDHSIGIQLGLSERTVQRRIRGLMEIAGVRTRIQLGWYAARHDWA